MEMLSSCICSTLVSVCAMRGIPLGRAGSVRKGLYILPHSFLLSSKLRYVVHVEGRTCLRAEYFTYTYRESGSNLVFVARQTRMLEPGVVSYTVSVFISNLLRILFTYYV